LIDSVRQRGSLVSEKIVPAFGQIVAASASSLAAADQFFSAGSIRRL
jgi:hypothetical protein